MYKIRLNEGERKALRRGDKEILISLLEQSSLNVIKDLKVLGSNTPYLQGISCITDQLLAALKGT